MKTLFCALAVICGLLCAFMAQAAPTAIDYQGFLRDTVTGEPLEGQHSLTFRLYDSLMGSEFLLWSETDSSVVLDQGVFSVRLGSHNQFTLPTFTQPALFLEVEVDAQVMSPRTQLVSVPYALFAQVAQQAAQADSSGFAVHAATADNATHAAYADSAGNSGGGTGDAHWAADGANIHNTNSGNVGIGTSPDTNIRLHVQGGGLNWASRFTNGTADVRLAYPNGAGVFVNYNGSENPGLLDLNQNAQSRFLVMANGYVGVGTSNPSYKLDVVGGSSSGIAIGPIAETGSEGGEIGLRDRHGALQWIIDSNSSDDLRILNQDAAHNIVLNHLGGNVGIGTTPHAYYKLQVKQGTDKNLGIRDLSGELAIEAVNDAMTADVPLRYYASKHSIMGGNVGIGTTSPSRRLEVTGTWPQLDLTDGTVQMDIGTSSGNLYIKNSSTTTGQLRIRRSDNVDRLAVDFATGNVGIGTIAPTAKLHVVGDLCVTGAKNRIVDTPFGRTKFNAVESAEAWFTKGGEGRLTDGRARVDLSEHFMSAVTISPSYPLQVDVTFYGPHGNWYLERDRSGFTVIDPSGGNSDFSWRASARQKGYETWDLKTDTDQAAR